MPSPAVRLRAKPMVDIRRGRGVVFPAVCPVRTMAADRPNPDELLARVQAAEARGRRGKLKIFFGYAAGVGKTYAMLEAARRERADGADGVVGYVEPHGRVKTAALLEGLEVLPPGEGPY